jgi:outer membrane biosynthesis protein TonB
MSRLPINPAFDRSANTRHGLRLALAVGLGTLALGVAAGAVATSAHQFARVAHVMHIDTAKATAPSALRGADLFSNPATAAPEVEAAAAAAARATVAKPASTESEVEKEHASETEQKTGVAPSTEDHSPMVHPAGGAAPAMPKPQPKPKPSVEPTDTPEPTPSAHD